jgi:hypothetical protein
VLRHSEDSVPFAIKRRTRDYGVRADLPSVCSAYRLKIHQKPLIELARRANVSATIQICVKTKA